MHYVSLLCTFGKVFKKFEVKLNIQKVALRFREELTIDVLVSLNSCFYHYCYMIIFLNDYLVRSCSVTLFKATTLFFGTDIILHNCQSRRTLLWL